MRRLWLVATLAAPAVGQVDFARDLFPVLERAQCRSCHSDNGVGSTTRLQFPREDAAPAQVRAFGLRLRAFVDPRQPDESLLFRKPTNRISHGGGERVKQGSADEKLLRQWIDYLVTRGDAPVDVVKAGLGPSKPALRRLTHSQYNHTVRDLLGEQTRPADSFPKEDFVNGFTNQAEGQSISPLQAEAYGKAAERLARNAAGAGRLTWGEDGIAAFGRRAFRRPLSAEEVERYRRAFRQGGAQLVVEAMLQSPHFLFHLEPAGYGVASRLSYFLWDTMPDEELLQAAGKGQLDSPAGIETQVRRMLADERARASMDEFLAQWLRFDRLRGAIRERRTFPEFNDELVNAMAAETTRFFRALVWENRNFQEFFTADYTYLAPETARVYGMAPPGEPWSKVRYDPASGRAGVLGQPLFLTLTSKPADTSPTERGIFIREHFLCQQVPPPPPGVDATLPAVTDERPVSVRERLGVHLSNPVCANCHTLVDPIGFGLEKFDAIGRLREKEKIIIYPTFDELKSRRKTRPTEYELPIDAKGFVRGLRSGEFSSPKELGAILADEPACQRCVVKQVFRYAVGRHEGPDDAEVIDRALERFRASQFRFQELIMAIATSETFR